MRGAAADSAAGQTFDAHNPLRDLVTQLGAALGARYALLGRIDEDEQTVTSVAGWADGRERAFFYDLSGSPCEAAATAGICIVPSSVRELFPSDTLLADVQAESYAGIPICDDAGRTIGILAAFDTEPAESVESIEPTLRLFGARARAELAREEAESALRDSKAVRDEVQASLARRDAILEALVRCSGLLLAASSWRAAIDELLELLGRATGASRAYLFESRVLPDGRVASSLTHEWLAEGIDPSLRAELWEDWQEPPELVTELELGTIYVQIARDLRGPLREAMDREGTLSAVSVPIVVGGTLAGYVGFDDCTSERQWTEAEAEALRGASALLAAALVRERSEDAARTSERILAAVALSAELLLHAPSWRTVIDDVLSRLGRASGSDRAHLFEASESGGALVSFTHEWTRAGVAPRIANPGWRAYRLSDDAVASFGRGEPFNRSAEEMPEPARSLMRGEGTASFASVPVFVEGSFWGFLGLDDCGRARGWTRAEEEALRSAAGMIGAAVERGLADEALRRSEAQLLQAQKMEAIGRLAGGIAHDFNTVLTGISGFAELLGEQVEGVGRAYAEEIIRATRDAQGLVRRLLAFGRPQDAAPVPLDLAAVIGELEGIVHGVVGPRVAIELEAMDGVPLVLADRTQLQQIVLNLVANARDAMPAGGTLHIVVAPAPGGAAARLVVEDSGHGMDEGTRSRIFEPFFTTRDSGDNSGLGLSSVYAIVRSSGGSIEVESEPGAGARFTVTLPAAPQ